MIVKHKPCWHSADGLGRKPAEVGLIEVCCHCGQKRNAVSCKIPGHGPFAPSPIWGTSWVDEGVEFHFSDHEVFIQPLERLP